MANRAMLLALDSADPPAEHDGRYRRDALLAANYSVPILWLSLFDTHGLVTWPRVDCSLPVTTVVQPSGECIERSRTRLEDWSRRWPQVFKDMSGPWLGYIGAVEDAYLAVWAVEMSGMTGDEEWAANLRAYLSGLNDPGSGGFRAAMAQSYLSSSGTGLEPFDKVGLVTAGYTWARQAPWEGACHPYWQRPICPGCPVCAR